MDQRFLSGDRSGETAADLKRTYRRGGSLGRRIPGSALDGPIRTTQKDEFVKCLMELKYLAEGTSLDPGGDRRKMGARILSTLCLAEAMQSDEGYQKILADELYNVFLKFIQVSRGGRGFTSLVFGMGQLSEEGIAKKIAEQISVIAFKAPRLLHMEKEFTLLREAALRAYRQEYPNREHFLNKY